MLGQGGNRAKHLEKIVELFSHMPDSKNEEPNGASAMGQVGNNIGNPKQAVGNGSSAHAQGAPSMQKSAPFMAPSTSNKQAPAIEHHLGMTPPTNTIGNGSSAHEAGVDPHMAPGMDLDNKQRNVRR